MNKFNLKKNGPSESKILNSIGEYLESRGHLFTRINNAPTFQPDGKGGGFFRKQSKWAMNGVPDIILIDETGHFVGIEVKKPGGKLSDAQIIFRNKCKQNGAEFYVVTSKEQLAEIGL